MDPNVPVNQTSAYLVGAVIGSLFVGALVGCIPWYLGKAREDRVVGGIGLVACMAGAFFAGILGAGSMAVGFVIAILVGGRRA
jgi:hypothetical protein